MSQDLFTALDRAATDADLIRLSVDDMIRNGRRRRLGVMAAKISVATAVVGVAAAGASVLPAPDGAPGSTTAGAAAAAVPDPAAAAASVTTCMSAPYWYTKSEYHDGGKLIPRQIWLGQSGDTRLADADKPSSWNQPMQWVVGSWTKLCTLTTDVPTLYTLLRNDTNGAGADEPSETFVEVGDLLRESPTPLGVRLALLDVAAMVPGAEVTAGEHDSLGRPVTKVSRVQGEDQGRLTYLIDSATGELLEENAGGWVATYLASGPVSDKGSVAQGFTQAMTAAR